MPQARRRCAPFGARCGASGVTVQQPQPPFRRLALPGPCSGNPRWPMSREASNAAHSAGVRRRKSPLCPRPSVLREIRLSDGRLAWPVAAAAGMSEATFRARLKRGLPADVAVSRPVATPAEAAAARRKTRVASPASALMRGLRLADGRSALQVALQGGVPAGTFRARLRRGWSVEAAALQPLSTPAERAKAAARRCSVADLRAESRSAGAASRAASGPQSGPPTGEKALGKGAIPDAV